MLKIYWGLLDETMFNVDREFMGVGHDMKWFDDPFVLALVHDIDNCSYDPVTQMFTDLELPQHKFHAEQLSSGSKGLILLYKRPQQTMRIWGTMFGDNCTPWLLKIAEKKDITIDLEHFLNFPEDQFKAYSIHQQKMYDDYDDYRHEVMRYGMYSWCKPELLDNYYE